LRGHPARKHLAARVSHRSPASRARLRGRAIWVSVTGIRRGPAPLAGGGTLSIRGKTALVTGSSGGLGFAMAEGLARAGCNVILHGLAPPDGVTAPCAELARTHGVAATYLQADLAQPEAIAALFAEIGRRHGGVDIL